MYLHYHINIHIHKQTQIFLQHKHAGMKRMKKYYIHNFVIVYNLFKPQKTRTKKQNKRKP